MLSVYQIYACAEKNFLNEGAHTGIQCFSKELVIYLASTDYTTH